jgi:hypothetical protein
MTKLSGPRGIRTPDLLNAIETRSQLRYGPGGVYDRISDLRLALQVVHRKSLIVNLWT